MAKKNRTGLQSEVSHIFAGVPVPKRKRPHPEEPEKKPKSQEPEKTVPAEKLPQGKSPVHKPPEKQPVKQDVTAGKTPAKESSAPKVPIERKRVEETPVEKMIAPQLQVEKEPAGQPAVVEPPVEQPSELFSQVVETPEFKEPVKKLQDLSSVRPTKSGIIEQRTEKIPRKVPVISKGKRLTSKTGVSSRRQTTMVILVIALSILLFFLLVKPFSKSSRNLARSGANIPTVPPLSIGANDKSVVINWSAPPVYPTEIRDPMLLSTQQFNSKTWKPNLSGIVYNENLKYAIIGTEIVEEGYEINGVKVVKINKDSVEFERDGQKWKQEVQNND
jgi:hypothetical protein